MDEKWLREACLAYDAEFGPYPEHEYEGLAVFSFLLARLQGKEHNPDDAFSGVCGWEESLIESTTPPDNTA